MVKVMLAGREYDYCLNMGALLVFEQFTEKLPEEMRTPQRLMLVMHYACIYASSGFELTFDEFIAAIDTQDTLEMLQQASISENKRWAVRNLASADAGKEETENSEASKKK